MNSKITAALSLVLLAAPLGAFAASRNSETVQLTESVTIGDTTVPAGTYRVRWDGTGNATATISIGKKVVATAPVVVTPAKSNYDGAVHTTGNALTAIEFKNELIQFGETGSASTSGQ